MERGTTVTVTTENHTILPEGSALSKLQLEALEQGADDGVSAGPIEGAALQDVAVNIEAIELYGDESTPQAIRIAVASAVREAIRNAGGAVMRPLMTITVVVPDKMGAVLGDLRVSAMISAGARHRHRVIHGGARSRLCSASPLSFGR